jgi:hypothetical protein
MLCPIRRPITTLDCVLLEDNNWAVVARLGPEINFWACLSVLQGPRHNTKCWLSIRRFIFLLMFCLETPKIGSGPTNLSTELSLVSLWVISLPHTSACPGTQYSSTVCWAEVSFNAFWHSHTNGDIVVASWSWVKGKGKAIPLQALAGPEGSRRLRLPDFKTVGTWMWWGCQPYTPAAFTPRKYSWYSFLLEAESTLGP